jgi:hypothetical protein
MAEDPENYSANRMAYEEWVNADGNHCKRVKLTLSRLTEEGVEVIRAIILQRVIETPVDGNAKDTFTYGVVSTMPDKWVRYLVSESELFHSASDLVKYMLDTTACYWEIPCEKTNVFYNRTLGFGNDVHDYGKYEQLTDPEKLGWALQSVQTMFDNIAAAVAPAAAEHAAYCAAKDIAKAAEQDRLAEEQDRLAANRACLEAIINHP